ncbi:UDP-N-acetylmuramoyl-L-alanine--D-glutamate ligase [Gottschalkiaceae bacterium SANA]|nr:UDP-N-acetylmuramoyl-L-alanine--D-glutamate ligase [Gottschalkiaceae bacterium SANA]
MEKIAVIGYGKNGQGNVEALVHMGYRVVVYDDHDIQMSSFGKEASVAVWTGDQIPEGLTLAIKSPGIRMDHPLIQGLIGAKIPVMTDVEFFQRHFDFPVIGITGTNGKTTTTTLVGEILRQGGKETCVAGNIGIGILPCAVHAEKDTWFVLELSSFQLESCVRFQPKVSTIINLRPDHLEWHGGYEAYKAAKKRLWMNAAEDDIIVVNQDDPELVAEGKQSKAKVIGFSIEKELEEGCFLLDDAVVYREKGETLFIASLDEIPLKGRHNYQNIAVAVALSIQAGVGIEAIQKTILSFQGISHRFEWLGKHGKRGFFNDSKGTNTEASVAAVQAVEGPKVLIGGGYDKGEVFGDFFEACRINQVHTVILMGQTASKMKAAAESAGISKILYASDLNEAVALSLKNSQEDDWILLSPACASWDQYKSYEERGEIFRQVVMKIEETD